MFSVGPVYHANYNATEDIIINQGGTDSGKTYAIIQILFTHAICSTPPQENPIITILSASVPDSKKGAYRLAKSIAYGSPYVMSKIKDWNETDRTIYFKSGWVMEFIGATTEQAAKQGKRQYLFVNEANGVSLPIFWQLAKRTRIRSYIDYNPSAPFWVHEKLIGTLPESNDLYATVKLIISDHRHNPFLSAKDHARTENIKDPELWKVYARGLTGNLEGLIYTNWKTIPDKDFPYDSDNKFGGVDFGYTNDPTAAVQMSRIGNKIFVHELCYEAGIGAKKLNRLYRAAKFDDEDFIYCDHDNDIIREMRLLDLMAVPARKSIKSGIEKVREYELYVTASSKNVEAERKKYMWMQDKLTGKFTNTPTEVDNHLMDAIRYGIATHFYKG